MAHIDDLYEAQAKQLLHKLCDALGIEQHDRTKSGVEKEIARLKRDMAMGAEITEARAEFGKYVWEQGGRN